MKLATFRQQGRLVLGLVDRGTTRIDVGARTDASLPRTLRSLLEAGPEALVASGASATAIGTQGRHARDTGARRADRGQRAQVPWPGFSAIVRTSLRSRRASQGTSTIPPHQGLGLTKAGLLHQSVPLTDPQSPRFFRHADYEGEMAVVIGRRWPRARPPKRTR